MYFAASCLFNKAAYKMTAVLPVVLMHVIYVDLSAAAGSDSKQPRAWDVCMSSVSYQRLLCFQHVTYM